MYFGSVANLLRAIGRDRHVNTVIENVPERDGTDLYIVTARAADGEMWRSQHGNLLLAVVMLERFMKSGRDSDEGEDLLDRPDCSTGLGRF